jgi:ribosome-binding protein aMBF1 (putative translation factor)
MITGGQIRAARAFLRWSADELAKQAKISAQTVRRAEREDGVPNMLANNMEAIRKALEAAGVQFTNDNGHGVKIKSA